MFVKKKQGIIKTEEEKQKELAQKDLGGRQLYNSVVILNDTQPMIFDLAKETWQLGMTDDVIDSDKLEKNLELGRSTDLAQYKFPDNCATMFMTRKLNPKDTISLVVSGGNRHSKVLSKVIGLQFKLRMEKGSVVVLCEEFAEFPRMPGPRYLHQSVGLLIENRTHMFVIGGKESRDSPLSLNTVWKLDMTAFIQEKMEQADKVQDMMEAMNTRERKQLWVECAPMNESRSMFAATVIDNKFIYVYGGNAGTNQGRNILPRSACERYDVTSNTWASFKIENAPSLFSFGWT
jgi:Kelch motif